MLSGKEPAFQENVRCQSLIRRNRPKFARGGFGWRLVLVTVSRGFPAARFALKRVELVGRCALLGIGRDVGGRPVVTDAERACRSAR